MLDEIQIETFRERGLVRLEGFLSPQVVDPARELLYRLLEGQGVRRDGEWCYDEHHPAWPDGGVKLVKETKRAKVFADLVTEDVLNAVDDLLGGQPVMTFMDRPQVLRPTALI